MPLTKLQFRPGINREVTNYSNEGGWHDGDKIRFRFGFPEKIGGWTRKSNLSFLNTCRALHPWVTLSNEQLIGVGTTHKYYVERGGGFEDITPLRDTTAAGDVTFAATDGSYLITVSDTSHGATEGDFVTFSGAVSLGGVITADVLNQEYQIVSVIDADSYTIEARTVSTIDSITVNGALAPTFVAANSSDSGDGGASVVGVYQINSGLDASVVGAGWGAGGWSRSTWGSATNQPIVTNTLRLWSHDNFGEDLLISVRDGGIYYWDTSAGFVANRAVALSDLAGANAAPTVAKQILVSDRDRHVIAFGCDSEVDPGTQDPLLIRFSNQESVTEWNSLPTNTAGDLRLGSGSEIVAAVETRQQIAVFTDTTLYAMQFLGPPFTFGVQTISENITIQSPNAAVAVNDQLFWMGSNEFYIYTGTVQRLPCTVRDYVFDDFNFDQALKVACALNAEFNEVWWFYPSSDSLENDRYVVYNYMEQVWYYGTLARTAWIDRGVAENPIAAGTDGHLYFQENGFDDGSTNPASAITSYVQSSPLDLADGEQFVFISRVLPDLQFRNSTNSDPSVDLRISVRNYPGGSYVSTQTNTITNSSEILYYRLRGRQMSLYFESTTPETGWRLGSTRVDMKPDGKR